MQQKVQFRGGEFYLLPAELTVTVTHLAAASITRLPPWTLLRYGVA
ncbi:hypothetical protein [Methyloceanibacter sp.]